MVFTHVLGVYTFDWIAIPHDLIRPDMFQSIKCSKILDTYQFECVYLNHTGKHYYQGYFK